MDASDTATVGTTQVGGTAQTDIDTDGARTYFSRIPIRVKEITMANHTKTVTLTDLQQQILSNDLYNDTDNAGLDKWIQDAVDGKINNCWKRMQREWTDKLMNDSSFTDPIPSNQADFVALVLARSDYKNRKARDDES